MKKILLLLAAGAVGFSANAQQLQTKSAVFNNTGAKIPVERTVTIPKRAASSTAVAAKGTAAPRWYSYATDIDALNGNTMQGFVIPMWFDSTVQQTFTSGAGSVNFAAASLDYDLVRFNVFNNSALHLNEMMVRATDTITVDSVSFAAVYEQNTNRPSTVVDTLIISVAPSTGRYTLTKQQYTWVAPYIPNKDTLYAFTAFNVDSVNRAAFSDVAGVNRIMWKMPLTAAMRDTGFNSKIFTFAVPNGGLKMVGANMFSATVAFKSGDTWVPNVTNIEDRHRWMPISAAMGTNTLMPYYYYDYNDRNTSSLMFTTDTSTFLPAVIIEGINTTNFRDEFHNIDVHILCATCPPITGINDVASSLSNVSDVFPNPAMNDATVKFTVNQAADVSVTVANSVGQVVKTQSLGKYGANQTAGARINVSNLSNGVYFVTVTANGQNVTKRLVVAH